MVFSPSDEQTAPRRRRGRARARVAGALLAPLAALAAAGGGLAQPPSLPAAPSVDGQGAVAAIADQPAAAVAQASQTAQAAGAQATTTQQGPVNVAIQIVVNSPGSSPVINQSNTAASSAAAGNASSTTQGATGSSGAGGTAGQSAATGQNAPAQATTAQSGATNVATTAVVGSPSASPAVNQANGAVSTASATNASTTTQTATGSGEATAAGTSAQPPAESVTSPAQAQPGGTSDSQAPALFVGGSGAGKLDDALWGWIWDVVAAALPPGGLGALLPAVPAFPNLGFGGVTLPDLPGLPDLGSPPAAAPKDVRPRAASGARSERSAAPAWVTAPYLGVLPPAPPAYAIATGENGPSLSSNFVQNGSNAGKTRRTELALPGVPSAPAPAGSAGAFFSGAGLVLGALFLIVLQLASAASALSRRFDLASIAWRRQAYLAPLERPG